MREILIFLESCPTEFKSDVASNIVSIAAKYAPNAQWHIDTILKVNIYSMLCHYYVIVQVLLTAGNSVPDQVIPILIHLISATTSLHQYTVTRLLESIKTDFTNQPLNQVASWCIGEYADVLIAQGVQSEGK